MMFSYIERGNECFAYDVDSSGNDLFNTSIQNVTDPIKCQELCMKEPKCSAFSVNLRDDPEENNGCWLKSAVGTPGPRANVVFGPKSCKGISFLVLCLILT